MNYFPVEKTVFYRGNGTMLSEVEDHLNFWSNKPVRTDSPNKSSIDYRLKTILDFAINKGLIEQN